MNKVYLGDCLEIMPELPDKSVDLILTDPPYKKTGCSWDKVFDLSNMWIDFNRIITDTGVIVITALQPFTSKLIISNLLMFKYTWVWNKNYASNFPAVKYMPLLTHEDICVFSKGGANVGSKSPMLYNPIMELREKPRLVRLNQYTKNIQSPKKMGFKNKNEIANALPAKYPKSVINISNSDHSKRLHPTQKPVALFEYLIKTYTDEGDVVLDPFAGSGTAGLACKNLNRNYILIEKDPKYYDIILKRLG